MFVALAIAIATLVVACLEGRDKPCSYIRRQGQALQLHYKLSDN